MTITAIVEQVTDHELAKFFRLIYDRIGVCISPQKKTLLSTRLRRRLRETGIKGFGKYYQHLTSLPSGDPEWDGFFQEITTHESYLFRDENHWNWFQQSFLPECVSSARKGEGSRSLRIWSAASSTGDEAVTVACCIAASLANFSQWKIEIVGTDVGAGAIHAASVARFNRRAMRLVPDNYRRRFFREISKDDEWEAKPILTGMLKFRQHNLMDPLKERPFDLVILKNVLIYFDNESKARVVKNIQSLMRPGSFLLCGASEGVTQLVNDMQRIDPWLYRLRNERSRT